LLLFTVTVAVAVQPFDVPVTVTVYVPAAFTFAVFVPATGVAPALQAYVAPVEGVAVKVTVGSAQVRSPSFVRPAVGGVVF
jgi:hypothetical protein